ncbi:hypothetical protein BDV95DRAFT_481972, partial [Massariosphaeria phaeospora]
VNNLTDGTRSLNSLNQMGIFTNFIRPTDPRWLGSQRHHLTLLLAKNVFLVGFLILVCVEAGLFWSWWKLEHSRKGDQVYSFWLRIGLSLVPELLLTPCQIYSVATQRWHPVSALVTSLISCGLWACALSLNVMLVFSNETGFPNLSAWYDLCYTEAGLQGVIALIYLVLMGFAAAAVHRYKKDVRLKRVQQEVERMMTG